MSPNCSCGAKLSAFIPSMADPPGGKSLPIYSGFSRFWEEPDWLNDPQDADWIEKLEADFIAGGFFACGAQDALNFGVNDLPPQHDVYASDGTTRLYEAHQN